MGSSVVAAIALMYEYPKFGYSLLHEVIGPFLWGRLLYLVFEGKVTVFHSLVIEDCGFCSSFV